MSTAAPSMTGHVWNRGRMVGYRLTDGRGSDTRPAILVVIPYYNAAPWIAACLAMLAANDEPHDVLVVDDGSDPPLDLPTSENLVHCRFDRNLGLIAALNFAAAFATEQGYRYYVRQDADDLSRPDRLRIQREAIERTGADLAICGVRAVDESGNIVWRGRISTDEAAFRAALATRNPAVHSTWFMRTDLFAAIGCYDERFKGAEDFDLLQRIARHGTIAIVPDELVDYLVRSGSILSGSRGPAWQTLRIVARHFDPASHASYRGIARALAAAIVPRGWKTRVRRLLTEARS